MTGAYGQFYSPEEVFGNLGDAARQYRARKPRISRAEPTLGKEHLLKVLVEASELDQFILETNDMLFGVDRGYVREISRFEKPHIRVSLKAVPLKPSPRPAKPETFELPFNAIRNQLDYDVSFSVEMKSLVEFGVANIPTETLDKALATELARLHSHEPCLARP